MSRRYRKVSKSKLPPFVPLTWKVLNSKAYIALPYSAAKILPYFLGKVKVPYRDPNRCSVDFDFTYSEAKKYGFATTTHYKAISELIAKGFIYPVSKGGLRGGGLSSSRFRLSERWREYGTKNFDSTRPWKQFHKGS